MTDSAAPQASTLDGSQVVLLAKLAAEAAMKLDCECTAPARPQDACVSCRIRAMLKLRCKCRSYCSGQEQWIATYGPDEGSRLWQQWIGTSGVGMHHPNCVFAAAPASALLTGGA